MFADDVLSGCVLLCREGVQRNNTEDSEKTEKVLVQVVSTNP